MPPAPSAVDPSPVPLITQQHQGPALQRHCRPATRPVKARPPRPRHRDRLRRVAARLRRAPKTGGSYYDPLFERPDLVEDDYYRFRHQRTR
jgi:hypothetical protein